MAGVTTDMLPGFYIRCEECGLVVPPSLVEYVLTPDRRRADQSYPVTARCGACGHAHMLPWTSVLPDDGAHTCPRCGVVTSAPAVAERVACDGCNMHYLAASAGPVPPGCPSRDGRAPARFSSRE